MKYANKLTVVPFKETLSSPQASYLSSLDKRMKNIVNSKASADEKIKLYNYLLENFMVTTQPDQPREVPKITPVETPKAIKPDVNFKVLKNLQLSLLKIHRHASWKEIFQQARKRSKRTP